MARQGEGCESPVLGTLYCSVGSDVASSKLGTRSYRAFLALSLNKNNTCFQLISAIKGIQFHFAARTRLRNNWELFGGSA